MARARGVSASSTTPSTATTTGTSTTAQPVPTNTVSTNDNAPEQEMSNMYDYLAKIILVGPSGCGKSCLLHRFVKGEWRVLSSQTIGVEFASKIVKIGGAGFAGGTGGVGAGGGGGAGGLGGWMGRGKKGGNNAGIGLGMGAGRKRIKLQLWDTAGTERFRSVGRSYYRGAAGAVLVYDVCDGASFAQLAPFLHDVRALGSGQVAVVLAGNKSDLLEENQGQADWLTGQEEELGSSVASTIGPGMGNRMRATVADSGTRRAVTVSAAAEWASRNRIPASMEVSALSGEGVDEVFHKLARMILTKIELGEIDPDDPMSGIQYGDAGYYGYDDGSSSIRSGGLTSDGHIATRRRRRRVGWSDAFRLRRAGSSGGGSAKCC